MTDIRICEGGKRCGRNVNLHSALKLLGTSTRGMKNHCIRGAGHDIGYPRPCRQYWASGILLFSNLNGVVLSQGGKQSLQLMYRNFVTFAAPIECFFL